MGYTTVEVYMGDFDDDALIEELESRGYSVTNNDFIGDEDKIFYTDLYHAMQSDAKKAWNMMRNRVYEKAARIVTTEINDKI